MINIRPQCADLDGCKMIINMTHKISGVDQTLGIQQFLYFENQTNSTNKHDGVSGYTRQAGGGEFSFRLGSNTRHTLFSPWNWIYLVNYPHIYCPGQSGSGAVYKNPYKLTLVTHPHVNATVIVCLLYTSPSPRD